MGRQRAQFTENPILACAANRCFFWIVAALSIVVATAISVVAVAITVSVVILIATFSALSRLAAAKELLDGDVENGNNKQAEEGSN